MDIRPLESKLKSFKSWLVMHGASVLAPTNEWEVVRFESSEGVSVVYRNKVGRVSFTGQAEAAWEAFRVGQSWSAGVRTKRVKMETRVRALRVRDGNLCFYCLGRVEHEDGSAEHLVAVAHGGPNHMSNLVLAHKACNARCGHMPVREKIETHVRARMERSATERRRVDQVALTSSAAT